MACGGNRSMGLDTARLVTGDVIAAVQALKDEPGDELQIWGSSQLLQTLLRHELVDRLRRRVRAVIAAAMARRGVTAWHGHPQPVTSGRGEPGRLVLRCR